LLHDAASHFSTSRSENNHFETVSVAAPTDKSGMDTRLLLPQINDLSRISSCQSYQHYAHDNSSSTHLDKTTDTDLVPGVYEGGLKVWECSLDLTRYLAEQIRSNKHDSQQHPNDVRDALSEGGSTLELGCGHGLPGCLILREALQCRMGGNDCNKVPDNTDGTDEFVVVFSDYNEFVLRDVTVPNIWANTMSLSNPTSHRKEDVHVPWTMDRRVASHVVLAAGDWMEMSHAMRPPPTHHPNEPIRHTIPSNVHDGGASMLRVPKGGRFDLILAAETTYTHQSCLDTVRLLGFHLKVNSGIGLVATKRYYFGVGGGSDAFREAASNETFFCNGIPCHLCVETLQVFDNGFSNIRELLRVKCISSTN